MDDRFAVKVIALTPNPQILVYCAMHQDYSENFVFDELAGKTLDENECGRIAVKRLLENKRGHFGCLEHPSISFNVGYFPHSAMQQLRTHRVGISFDVQSFRYTGSRITEVAEGKRELEEVFYLRPIGTYTNRQGKKYFYDEKLRETDINDCYRAAIGYKRRIEAGMSEEHARALVPFDIRQHFVFSVNIRSLMHVLDLRAKKDAQLEIQHLSSMLMGRFKMWCPEIAAWYEEHRFGKALLSP